jgi:hypothetical protein
MVWEDAFTIASNLAFVFPAVEAAERQFWPEAIIYFAVVLCSSLYHGCNSFGGTGCIGLPPHLLRDMDFYTAQLCIPLIALYAIKPWADSWYAFKTIALSVVAMALFFAQRYWGNAPDVQLLVAGLSFGAIFVYWGLYVLRQLRSTSKVTHYLPKYRWSYFALGIGLSGAAVSLYAAEMLNHQMYWAIHSCWHLDAALGQLMLLKIWPRKEKRLYHDKKDDHKGKRVVLLGPLTDPHVYALPVPRRDMHHLTPRSRVVVKVNE